MSGKFGMNQADALNGPTHEELLAFLSDPGSYPHQPADVRVVQTHASLVAIASPYVYKVKKAVEMGFLDFSTLPKRRHFCEEEIRLNRRLCPGIYEGVVPISQRSGALAFGEGGEIVEYAVKMKELSAGGFLHERLDAAGRAEIDRVADALVAFYRNEGSAPEIAEWGRISRLRLSTDENFRQTEPLLGEALSRSAWEAIRYGTDRFYDQQALLFNQRRAGGWIRECHGDLRLEHVHLTAERVCIYDCIEFNERLRYIDVASDVAFLAMDLDRCGRRDLALYFIQRTADSLGDAELPILLPFYACYRAFVRGKVALIRAAEAEVPASERATAGAEARQYFRQALRYAVGGNEPLVLVVMGGVGTGKSTQARALADALGWEPLSSDRIRKELGGIPPDTRADNGTRARLYSPEMTERTYKALRRGALERASRGEGTVLDATFGDRSQRDKLRETCREAGVPWVFAELRADDEAVRERLQQRERAHGVISDARLADLESLNARYEAPDALEDALHFTVGSADAPEKTTTRILRHLVRLAPIPENHSAFRG